MGSQGLQGFFGHGVHRESCSQCLDIKNVGSFGVLGSGARPQQTLRTTAQVVNTLPTRGAEQSAGCRVCALRDRDAKLVTKFLRSPAGNGHIPPTDKDRCHGANLGIEAGIDAAFYSTQVRVGRGQVLFAREQKGDVDRNASEDGLLDCWKALRGAWNLDE